MCDEDSIPLQAVAAFLPLAAKGHFSKVFIQGNRVLKVSRAHEGTMNYIEWCLARRRFFGEDSKEMDNLPIVYDFGKTATQWWCIMERVDRNNRQTHWDTKVGLSQLIQRLNGLFGRDSNDWSFCGDVHGDNIMWCARRQQYILTDPSSGEGIKTPTEQPRWHTAEPNYCPSDPVPIRPRFRDPAQAFREFLDREEVHRQVAFMDEFRAMQHRRFHADKDLQPIRPMYSDDVVPVATQTDSKAKKQADWKLPQLQRQQHMQR